MRVMQLIPSLHVGGAERIVALLSRSLQGMGHTVEVVALGPAAGSFLEENLRAAGVELRFLGKGPGLDLRAIPRLARALQAARPDVVHTHLHVLKYLLPARLRHRRCAVVHTVHNLAENEASPLDRRLQGRAFRGGVEPVAIGDAVAESMAAVYGRRPRHTIPNGIPTARFQAQAGTRGAVRAELGLPAGAPVLVTVGRLNVQKDQRLLLEAFADRRLAGLGARLLVVGDGELRGELEGRTAALGLADRVDFLGVRGDVPRLLAAADAFVLSSRWEGNPLVVMEAMAAGVAVVSTAVGCVPELVSAETGRLVPSGDAAALAGAMVEISQDLDAAHQLGVNGAGVAAARFDVSVMAQAYARLYEDLARGTSGP